MGIQRRADRTPVVDEMMPDVSLVVQGGFGQAVKGGRPQKWFALSGPPDPAGGGGQAFEHIGSPVGIVEQGMGRGEGAGPGVVVQPPGSGQFIDGIVEGLPFRVRLGLPSFTVEQPGLPPC